MRWLFLIALTGATAGCATVANDQRENIPIRSEPAGAVVSVNCGNAPIYGGVTPAVIIIERTADPCSVTIAKDGYEEKTVDMERQIARAKALESGSLPPLGLHILIGPAYPAVVKNMVRNLEEHRIELLNAVLQRV